MDIQTYRQTDRQTYRETVIQIDKLYSVARRAADRQQTQTATDKLSENKGRL